MALCATSCSHDPDDIIHLISAPFSLLFLTLTTAFPQNSFISIKPKIHQISNINPSINVNHPRWLITTPFLALPELPPRQKLRPHIARWHSRCTQIRIWIEIQLRSFKGMHLCLDIFNLISLLSPFRSKLHMAF